MRLKVTVTVAKVGDKDYIFRLVELVYTRFLREVSAE
jgi:hypothetical protein